MSVACGNGNMAVTAHGKFVSIRNVCAEVACMFD